MGKQKTLTLYERALEEGREEGELKKALETALNMKNLGLSIEVIQKSVGLSEEELKEHGIL